MRWSYEAMRRTALCILCAAFALTQAGCATKVASLAPDSCPPWTATSAGGGNSESTGLGCTNALNLKHMVAEPSDLKTGKTLGPADGAREALAVEAYKQGKVKELKQSGTSTSTATTTGGTK